MQERNVNGGFGKQVREAAGPEPSFVTENVNLFE